MNKHIQEYINHEKLKGKKSILAKSIVKIKKDLWFTFRAKLIIDMLGKDVSFKTVDHIMGHCFNCKCNERRVLKEFLAYQQSANKSYSIRDVLRLFTI